MKNLKALLGLIFSVISISIFAGSQIVMDGSTTVGPLAKAFAEYYMNENPDVNITVGESGSGNGAKSLINSTCDIGNMSRFMKQNEFEAAVKNGVLPIAHVVALDGIAIIVHPSNRIKNLTIEQIRDIYTGKIKNWKELGGANLPINVISRDTNSGTFETFHKLVMTHKIGGKKVKEKIAGFVEKVGSNGQARARVQSTKGAIGYVGIGFIDNSVKAITVNNVEASIETIQSGEYPIARPLYMFTNGYPKLGSHLYKFINLHLTEKGQEIVEEIGFIPLTNY